ncbi:MAG TPA: hypothetical protein ENO21_00005 [Firmicutes bacterium]|nr:hypothetical protein [Bacillota bacterium]
MLRILPTLGSGGTERQCLEVISFIHGQDVRTPAGHPLRIDLVTLYGPPTLHRLAVPDGVSCQHLNLPRSTAGIFRSAGPLRGMLGGYDCAHAMLWPAVWALARPGPLSRGSRRSTERRSGRIRRG